MRCESTFRIVISSTFSDSVAQRSALQRSALPRLRVSMSRSGDNSQAIGPRRPACVPRRTHAEAQDDYRPALRDDLVLGVWRELDAILPHVEARSIIARNLHVQIQRISSAFCDIQQPESFQTNTWDKRCTECHDLGSSL